VGKGKLTVDDFKKIIEAKDRSVAGTSAPAHGLFLVDIEYPEELMRE
jgi:tRNA pseudouridine38-40 synthase